MGDGCITCKRPVTSRQQGIQCDVCLQWNHRTCNTGKLPFILHFHSVCKILFDLEVMSGILQQEIVPHSYLDRLGLHSLSVFCPVAESSRISMTKSSAKILESSEFNPRSTQSDSFQSTIYNPPPLPHSRKLLFLNVILIGARF